MSARVPRGRLQLILLASAVLAGCAKDAPQDALDPAGPNAQKIDNLQKPVFAIAGVVLLLVAAAVTWVIFRYRDRGQPIPVQSHGKPALEIGLTILPALILVGIAIPTVGTLFALADTDELCVCDLAWVAEKPENLVSLCLWCHLFGVHAGRIRARGPASDIRWELGREPILVVHRRTKLEHARE